MSQLNEVANDFLVELLSLQQDGKQAISAPSNWSKQRPLLEVATEIDPIIDLLADTVLCNNRSELVASWHFFIGSPGNGKSAAVGRLSRLLRAKGCSILDESGTHIEDLQQETIPYSLRVLEGDNRYASAMIVQDASVVKDPFNRDVDPAAELCEILEEAWDKGVSVVVCTNRGVIEKAYRERYLNKDYNSKLWFKVLGQLIENGEHVVSGKIGNKWQFGGDKNVFPEFQVTYSYLDNRSIVLGSEVLESIIASATEDSKWAVCNECGVKNLCPFKLNRDWLHDDHARSSFLKVLCRAEVLSGQIIVFREALALLSLILAGCPKDYGEDHPCLWVNRHAQSNGVFALAMRRIYMSMFSSFCPYGLESERRDRDGQYEALQTLLGLAKGQDTRARAQIAKLLDERPPSSDVGITRLTGSRGVITEIDAWLDTLPDTLLESWDCDLAVIAKNTHPLFSDIEVQCLDTWMFLEELTETTLSHESSRMYWSLRRWSSNFLLHFGTLLEGLTVCDTELDEFISLLEILNKKPRERSLADKQRIKSVNRQLEELLAARVGLKGEYGVLPLSDSVALSGRWVTEKLRPKLQTTNLGNLTLSIEFRDQEIASVSCRTFIWLRRHLRRGLNVSCFPEELLTGIVDARVRAASKGEDNYARANDEVELRVAGSDECDYLLSRFDDGDVNVDIIKP